MSYKPFSKQLFKENDKLTREWAKKFFGTYSWAEDIKDNPDKYGPDLIISNKKGKFICYVECERKLGWDTYNFLWTDVQIPNRKAKYLKLNKKIFFFIANAIGTRCFITDRKNMLNSVIKVVPNKYKDNEKFYKVKITNGKFKDLFNTTRQE